MNNMDILKGIMSGGRNPQQFIMQNLMKNNQNPMMKSLVDMAQKGNSQGIENFARNIFKEKGRDFDKEFTDFMGKLK